MGDVRALVQADARYGPSAFMEDLAWAWHDAEGVTGSLDTLLRIGDLFVSLRSAGAAVARAYMASVRHLAVPTGTATPDLTVHLWDTATSGVTRPAALWSPDAFSRRVPNEVDGYTNANYATIFDPTTSTLLGLDRSARQAWQHVPDADAMPYWDKSFPLRMLLHYWLRSSPWQLVHAAAVGSATGAVLLPGRSGSGKSTTALLAVMQGLQYAGDDYVLVDCESRRVHSLYGIAKVETSNLHRVEALSPWIVNADRLAQEKAMIDVAAAFPDRVDTHLQIRALVLPCVTGHAGRPRLLAASPAEGLLALAPSTMLQLRADGAGTFGKLQRLASGLPVYRLELGSDLRNVSARIQSLLEEVAT